MNTQEQEDEFMVSVKSFWGTFMLVIFIMFIANLLLYPPDFSTFFRDLKAELRFEDFFISSIALYGTFLLYHHLRQVTFVKGVMRFVDRMLEGKKYD